jgi:uncharacterized protein YdaT
MSKGKIEDFFDIDIFLKKNKEYLKNLSQEEIKELASGKGSMEKTIELTKKIAKETVKQNKKHTDTELIQSSVNEMVSDMKKLTKKDVDEIIRQNIKK